MQTPPPHGGPQPEAVVLAEPRADVQGTQRGAVSRRNLMRMLSAATMAAVLLPYRWAQAKKVGLKMSSLKPLNTVGGSVMVKVKGQELLLIRDAAQSVRALDPMCTHKKCKVFYRAETRDIGCKCHKSKFTLDGKPVSGPAPRPLGRFDAKIKGEQLIIDLK